MCPQNLARRGQTTPKMFGGGGVFWLLRVYDHDRKPGSLLHSDITLTVHGGSQIMHRGTIAITCSYKRESTRVSFYVTEIPGPAIVGLQSSTALKLFICNFTIHENVTHPAPIQLARSNPWKRQIARDQLVSRMLQRSAKVPRRIPHSPWTKFTPNCRSHEACDNQPQRRHQ